MTTPPPYDFIIHPDGVMMQVRDLNTRQPREVPPMRETPALESDTTHTHRMRSEDSAVFTAKTHVKNEHPNITIYYLSDGKRNIELTATQAEDLLSFLEDTV